MGTAQKDIDQLMMSRALALAVRGEGFTAPNPMVGCVIAHGATVIGEGWHRGRGWHADHGLPHAEIEALRMAHETSNSSSKESTQGATAYITLEPCNHHGSTPPCSQALIKAGIKRVVYAMADPNGIAAGGAFTLRAADISVQEGPCTEQAHTLNYAWLHRTKEKSPYVIAKFAASIDGRIATRSGESKWITGAQARSRSHDLRQASDAIIVGAETIIADNPSLTVRTHNTPAHPLRIILDSTARTNPLAKVYHKSTPGHSLLVTTDRAPQENLARFTSQNIDVLTLPADANERPELKALLSHIHALGLNQIMVEGGADVLGSFFDASLVNEVWAFTAPIIIGGQGKNAIGGKGAEFMADTLRLENISMETLGSDILTRGTVPDACNASQREETCSQVS